jgi:hypothetical protein
MKLPFEVFEATSPDGKGHYEKMPVLAWKFGSGPMMKFLPRSDCLQIDHQVPAQEFLHYVANSLKMVYDGDAPVPPAIEAKYREKLRANQAKFAPQYAAAGIPMPVTNRQLARANVKFLANNVLTRGQLEVIEDCTEQHFPAQPVYTGGPVTRPGGGMQMVASVITQCTAQTTMVSGPANEFDALVKLWDSPRFDEKPEDAWVAAWTARYQEMARQVGVTLMQMIQAQGEASRRNFEHSMAAMQQQHEEFMQGMRDQYQGFQYQQDLQRTARDNAASDWVDFALDRQTMMDTRTGVIYKAPLDVTAVDPMVQVHGNGNPK